MLWPAGKIKAGYEAIALATDDGKVIQGYPQRARRDVRSCSREADHRREVADRPASRSRRDSQKSAR